MYREPKVVHSVKAEGWDLEIVRSEVKGKIRGYFVTALNEKCAITLAAISTKKSGSASVAFAEALRYTRDTEEGLKTTGNLPAYRPLSLPF